jgi:hypothetical protein
MNISAVINFEFFAQLFLIILRSKCFVESVKLVPNLKIQYLTLFLILFTVIGQTVFFTVALLAEFPGSEAAFCRCLQGLSNTN